MIEFWLEQAGKAHSYRRMYKMALDLLRDTRAPHKIRRQASRLRTTLSPVIDQPIAPAAQLAQAQREFRSLHTLLEEASKQRQNDDRRRLAAPDAVKISAPARPSHAPCKRPANG